MSHTTLHLTLALLAVPAVHAAWTFETIATNSFAPSGQPNRALLALRTILVQAPIGSYVTDRYYIAYREATGELKVASPATGGGWTVEVVWQGNPLAAAAEGKNEFSLAIDTAGVPHVTNFNAGPTNGAYSNFRVLRRVPEFCNGLSAAWDCAMIVLPSSADSFIRVGTNLVPHLLYSTESNGQAVHKFWNEANRFYGNTQIVGTSAKGLAIDSSNRPILLVSDSSTPANHLFTRSWTGAAWLNSAPFPAVSGDLQWYNGAARACLVSADSNGFIAIRYGTLFATLWSTSVAATVPTINPGPSTNACSLTFKAGRPVTAYFHGASRDLKIAKQQSDLSWTIETVLSLGQTGYHPSIGTTSQGKLRIVFSDSTGNIRMAKEQ